MHMIQEERRVNTGMELETLVNNIFLKFFFDVVHNVPLR